MGLFIKKNEDLMITVLRFAGGALFVWFGLHKLISPELWFGWVPKDLWQYIPVEKGLFLRMHGVLEFTAGLALILGRFMRTASAFCFLFLVSLVFIYGADDITLRDSSLAGIYLALFIHGNRVAEKKLPRIWMARLVTLFLFFLLCGGVLFVRSA